MREPRRRRTRSRIDRARSGQSHGVANCRGAPDWHGHGESLETNAAPDAPELEAQREAVCPLTFPVADDRRPERPPGRVPNAATTTVRHRRPSATVAPRPGLPPRTRT